VRFRARRLEAAPSPTIAIDTVSRRTAVPIDLQAMSAKKPAGPRTRRQRHRDGRARRWPPTAAGVRRASWSAQHRYSTGQARLTSVLKRTTATAALLGAGRCLCPLTGRADRSGHRDSREQAGRARQHANRRIGRTKRAVAAEAGLVDFTFRSRHAVHPAVRLGPRLDCRRSGAIGRAILTNWLRGTTADPAARGVRSASALEEARRRVAAEDGDEAGARSTMDIIQPGGRSHPAGAARFPARAKCPRHAMARCPHKMSLKHQSRRVRDSTSAITTRGVARSRGNLAPYRV